MRLSEHIYKTISSVRGPLLFVQRVFNSRIGEVVNVIAPDGRHGKFVLEDAKKWMKQKYGSKKSAVIRLK